MKLRHKKFSSTVARGIRGASLPEYGLVVGLIALAAIGSVHAAGNEIRTIFSGSAISLNSAGSGAMTGGGGGAEESLPAWRIESEDLGFPAGGMVLTYNANNFNMRVQSGPGGATVHWADSSTTTVPPSTNYIASKNVGGAVPQRVVVTGDVISWNADTAPTASGNAGLTQVNSFGNVGLQSLMEAFRDEDGLTHVAPLPSTVTNLQGLFFQYQGTPEGVSEWDVSNVLNMRAVVYNSGLIADLSGWDVSGVPFDTTYGFEDMFGGSTGDFDLSSWCNPNYSAERPSFAAGASGTIIQSNWWANNDC